MKKYLCFLLCLMAVVACQQDVDFVPVEDVAHEEVSTNPYAISIEKALTNLEDFMMALDETRAEGVRVVSDITPIKYVPTTRSGENIDCENILFVANFENNQGYAILSGDERIEQPILVVTDDGNLDAEVISYALDTIYDDRIYVEGYPTTGPGFFTMPETGDELFINPNTVNLYDVTEDDTLVGNYDFSSAIESGAIVVAPPSELLTSHLCVVYVLDQLQSVNNPTPHNPSIIDGSQFEGVAGSEPTPPMIHSEYEYSNWHIVEQVSPMMVNTQYWRQREPFNDLCPKRYNLCKRERGNAPSGCFPLAIAKLLTYLRYPSTFYCNNYRIMWDELQTYPSTTFNKTMAANLLRGIGKSCSSLYFAEGTFTFPGNATTYLKRLGFTDVNRQDYDFNTVKSMLDNNSPVIIYAVPDKQLKKSHSWCLDGYKIRTRTKIKTTYAGSTPISSTTTTETSRMVHCDFGWSGMSNGYYVSNVFKINDPSAELDPGMPSNDDSFDNYTNHLKIITYERP